MSVSNLSSRRPGATEILQLPEFFSKIKNDEAVKVIHLQPEKLPEWRKQPNRIAALTPRNS
jgi:hypothetical protein